jgi:hypothetical protein
MSEEQYDFGMIRNVIQTAHKPVLAPEPTKPKPKKEPEIEPDAEPETDTEPKAEPKPARPSKPKAEPPADEEPPAEPDSEPAPEPPAEPDADQAADPEQDEKPEKKKKPEPDPQEEPVEEPKEDVDVVAQPDEIPIGTSVKVIKQQPGDPDIGTIVAKRRLATDNQSGVRLEIVYELEQDPGLEYTRDELEVVKVENQPAEDEDVSGERTGQGGFGSTGRHFVPDQQAIAPTIDPELFQLGTIVRTKAEYQWKEGKVPHGVWGRIRMTPQPSSGESGSSLVTVVDFGVKFGDVQIPLEYLERL